MPPHMQDYPLLLSTLYEKVLTIVEIPLYLVG